MKKKIEQAEEVIKEDPSIGNIQIKHRDYKLSRKLNKEIRFEIVKAGSVDTLQKKMKKYRKQRNIILAGSLLTVGAVVAGFKLLIKEKDRTIQDLDKLGKEAQETVQDLSTRVENLKKENKELKNNTPQASSGPRVKSAKFTVKIGGTDVVDNIELAKQKAAAMVEVTKDGSSDILSCITEGVKTLTDKKTGLGKKIDKIGDVIHDGKNTIKNIFGGKQTTDALKNKVDDLQNKLDHQKSILEKLTNKLNKVNDSEKRKEIESAIDFTNKEIVKLERAFNAAEDLYLKSLNNSQDKK